MVTSFLLISIIMAGLALSAWLRLDHRADREAMNRLASVQPARPACFDPAMIADLPEPARRYFLYTIGPGTPLYTVANITMAGRFGMGTKSKPNYLDMTANQTLAMPDGFVWKMHARRGPDGSIRLGQRMLDAVLADGVAAGRADGWGSGSYALSFWALCGRGRVLDTCCGVAWARC
jgi:hypothetical protein